MHLKRFRGKTVSDALAAAHAELGSEALVLSTLMVQAAGMRGLLGAREVEVTAAADRGMSESRPQEQDPRHERRRHDRQDRRQAPQQEHRPERRKLQRRVVAADEASSVTDTLSGLAARLEAAGFSPAIAREMRPAKNTDGRRDPTAEAVRAAITEWVTPFVAQDDSYAAVEVFVGPPGAGKTTTVAKIAAQERARRGARLRLISADGFRVGAVEQLRLYADIIGAPFVAARTPGDLDRALIESNMPVLVDTAGRSPHDGAAREVLAVLQGARGVRTHLVVPAGSSAREINRLLKLHSDTKLDRLVLTKVDEAEAAAPLAAVLRDSGLKVSYLGIGQHVPDDLLRATPAHLAAAMVGDCVKESAA